MPDPQTTAKRPGKPVTTTLAAQQAVLARMAAERFDPARHARFSHAHYLARARACIAAGDRGAAAGALTAAAIWRGLLRNARAVAP